MKKQLPQTSQGFTLIELMIVVAIIAILSAIGMTVFGNVQQNARNAQRRADIQAISNALEANYDNSGASYKNLAGSFFASGSVPVDPISARSYSGTAAMTVGFTTYSICSSFETSGSFCLQNQR